MESFKKVESFDRERQILNQLKDYLAHGYLLHGSKTRNEEVSPRQASDTDPDRVIGSLQAVYAADDIRIPIFMALQEANNGEFGYSGSVADGVLYVYGDNLTFSSGYIHVLPPETFEIVKGENEEEIISRVPVAPIQIIEITPSILNVLSDFHVVSKEERDAFKKKLKEA